MTYKPDGDAERIHSGQMGVPESEAPMTVTPTPGLLSDEGLRLIRAAVAIGDGRTLHIKTFKQLLAHIEAREQQVAERDRMIFAYEAQAQEIQDRAEQAESRVAALVEAGKAIQGASQRRDFLVTWEPGTDDLVFVRFYAALRAMEEK